MKIMRVLQHLPLVFVVLLCNVTVFTPATNAQTIYALLLIDDANPTNFTQHETSRKRIENVLKKVEDQLGLALEISTLKTEVGRRDPAYPTTENIKKWIDTVNVDRNDVVFVYASAHGGANRNTRELYLNFSGTKVDRPPIAKALKALPCRLKILITDACSYGVPISVPYVNPTLQDAYRHLFVEHRGFLDVASATEGEYAGGDDKGGWFTVSLVEVLEDAHTYDTNRDGFVSWKEVFEATRQKTEEKFRVLKANLSENWRAIILEVGQETQRPKYFGQLPRRVN